MNYDETTNHCVESLFNPCSGKSGPRGTRVSSFDANLKKNVRNLFLYDFS